MTIPNVGDISSGAIDSINGYAYFGTYESPAKIIKVDLEINNIEDIVILEEGEEFLTTALIDQIRGYIYFGTNTNQGKVIRVDLDDLLKIDSVQLDNSKNGYFLTSIIDTKRGYAYFG